MAARTPPPTVVRTVQEALAADGVVSVVGGSGLLVSLGLAELARDWDLVVDADPAVVRQTLDRLALRYVEKPATGMFRTSALLRVDGGDHEVDVIVGFALEAAGGVVRVPARAGESWRGLVMADPRDWAVAYRLMGRADKAASLESWLAQRASG